MIDGNPVHANALGRSIEKCGFDVTVEPTGRDAHDRLGPIGADAVILNLDLADAHGLEALLVLRERGVLAPLLVVTSRSTVEWRVAALDTGADDCLVRPFAISELVARLRALLRRPGPRSTATRFGDLKLESHRRVVLVGGNTIILSPRENAILRYLVRRGCHVASRREILSEAFGLDFDPGTNVVEVHIAHLRRKLAGCETRIETVRGAGYRLCVGPENESNALL